MFHFQIQCYIHHRDHHYVLLIRACNKHINKLKTNDPCKSWIKISKVMPQHKSISPWEREGSPTAESPNLPAKIWYGLTIHTHFSHFKFTKQNFSIFQIYACLLAKFPANYANSTQFALQFRAPFIYVSDVSIRSIHSHTP